MAVSFLNSLDWNNLKPEQFIDQIVKNANVVSDFSLIDGVKSTVEVPIYDATIEYGQDKCVYDPQSSATIDFKQMAVADWNWGFVNCKNVLETTYRSLLLKKGTLNEETLDADFQSWLVNYFGKLVAQKVITQASTELIDKIENGPDAADVIPFTIGAAITKSNILGYLEDAYEAMEGDLLDSIYGATDRMYSPVVYMNGKTLQAYQLATAALYTTTPESLNGEIRPYMGMAVRLFSTLPDDTIIITPPNNLVMLTDEYADANAIWVEYDKKTNSTHMGGQFKLGFDFRNGAHIVYGRYEA